MCTHEQSKRLDYNQVILSNIADGQRAHTIYGAPPPPLINIKPDLGFPQE